MPTVWYTTIGDQYRLRIGRELSGEVNWLSPAAGSKGKCAVLIGSYGQAVFFPEDGARALQPEIDKALSVAPVKVTEISASWVDYARFVAAQWSVTWGFEQAGDRFVFYLTRELFHLGILPDEKEKVAVFAEKAFLEVWKPDLWVEHAKELGRDLNGLTARAKAQLESR